MRIIVALSLLLTAALSGCASLRPNPVAVAQDFVGSYGDCVGHIGWLKLERDGKFDCFIYNGSVDGCLTVRGSGMTAGTWELNGGVVRFGSLREPSDLVLSFEGAAAVLSEEGLIVTAGGIEHRLVRGDFAW